MKPVDIWNNDLSLYIIAYEFQNRITIYTSP